MSSVMTDSRTVVAALKTTPKGRLKYAVNWDDDNISNRELVNSFLPETCLSPIVHQLTAIGCLKTDEMVTAESITFKARPECNVEAKSKVHRLKKFHEKPADLQSTDIDDRLRKLAEESPMSSNVYDSSIYHQQWLKIELKAVENSTKLKREVTVIEKRNEYQSRAEKLAKQCEYQQDKLHHVMGKKADADLQHILEIEQAVSEDAKEKQNIIRESHRTRAKEQHARYEKECERIRSLELEQQNRIRSALASLHEQALSYASDLSDLMSSCRHRQHLSTSAERCKILMDEVTSKMENEIRSAKNGQPVDHSDQAMFAALVAEAQKIVEAMKIHIAEANRIGDEAEAKAAAAGAANAAVPTSTGSKSSSAIAAAASVSNQRPMTTAAVAPSAALQETKVTAPTGQTRAATSSSSALQANVSDDVVSIYQRSLKLIEEATQTCERFTKDPLCKKDRFDLQKAVNTPINGIAPENTGEVVNKLRRLLSGENVDVAGSRNVCARKHDVGILFCKQLLAKKLVKQGEEQVSSNHESAFYIAKVAVGIWSEFPDVGDLILAYFYQMCPYLLPYYVPMSENQGSREDYYRSLGYVVKDDGEIEQQDMFLRRMTGFVRLYAAITVTPLLSWSRTPGAHPHNVDRVWIYLARTINVEPRLDITASAVGDMLAVSGHALARTYGRQFLKLIRLIADEYMPKVRATCESGSSGPIARLEGLLRDAMAGRLPAAPTVR